MAQQKFFTTIVILVIISCALAARPTFVSAQALPSARLVREIELVVTTGDYDPVRFELGKLVGENWRKLGFQVKVRPMETSRLVQEGLRTKSLDAFTLRQGGKEQNLDPDDFLYT